MSKPVNDIWKDPHVKEALKAGRPTTDIAVLSCPNCNRKGYYNEGSHFSCRFCNITFYCCSENETPPEHTAWMRLEEMLTLADTVTETTDGYDNRTL